MLLDNKWIHLVNGSNWANHPRHKEIVEKQLNFLKGFLTLEINVNLFIKERAPLVG